MLKERFAYALILATVVSWTLVGQPSGGIVPSNTTFSAFVGEPFSVTFSCTQCSPNTLIALTPQSPLPTGLTYSTVTRTLSGTPTVPNQTATFTVTGSNDGVQSSGSYRITTDRRLSFLTTSPLTPATAGVPVTRTVQVSANSVWDTGASTLPAGVSISIPGNSSVATLSGTFPR